jgi:hypothetical protein
MTRKTARSIRFYCLPIALLACSLPAAPAALAAGVPRRAHVPLAAPSYHALSVCPSPTHRHASCLALQLTPRAGSAAAHTLSARAQARAERSAQASAALPPGIEESQQPTWVEPAELHSAYGLPVESPAAAASQTIALVDAYNDPHAEADLEIYDRTFGLPECTVSNGCFEQVNQSGETTNLPFPASEREMENEEDVCKGSRSGDREAACAQVEEATGWSVEISTDVDVAHSVCQNCRIRLVEAASAEYSDLEAAEQTAARPAGDNRGLGATEISNSWGGEEPAFESPAFDHPGIVITAAAGDDGYRNWTEAQEAETHDKTYYAGADYPASSPHVVAVGGTKLTLTSTGARQGETVWNEDPNPEGGNSGAGGGGCSAYFSAPAWQRAVPDWSRVGCGSERAVADVAADGDPYTGVLVYDSSESKEYMLVIGGTSVASPIIASTFALAGGAQGVEYPAQTLYAHLGSASLYDVSEGGNGRCASLYSGGCEGSMNPLSALAPYDCGQQDGQDVLICNAAAGYDGPSGVGTPNGLGAFEPSGEGIKQIEERKTREKEAQERKTAQEHAAQEKQAAEEHAAQEAKRADEEKQAAEAAVEHDGSGSSNAGSDKGTSESLTSTGGSSGSKTGKGSATAPLNIPRITELKLTVSAIAALDRGRPAISRVAFTFKLNASARVRVALARQTAVHGRRRWVLEPGSFTYAAARGHDRLHLDGHTGLTPGLYRLTLAPAHGNVASISFVLD